MGNARLTAVINAVHCPDAPGVAMDLTLSCPCPPSVSRPMMTDASLLLAFGEGHATPRQQQRGPAVPGLRSETPPADSR